MSEFKGTKCKWELTHNKRGIEVYIKPRVYKSICSSTGNIKWKYDMLLISKAPEMLEMLKKVLEVNKLHNFNGHLINEQIEQLIKQATEI